MLIGPGFDADNSSSSPASFTSGPFSRSAYFARPSAVPNAPKPGTGPPFTISACKLRMSAKVSLGARPAFSVAGAVPAAGPPPTPSAPLTAAPPTPSPQTIASISPPRNDP